MLTRSILLDFFFIPIIFARSISLNLFARFARDIFFVCGLPKLASLAFARSIGIFALARSISKFKKSSLARASSLRAKFERCHIPAYLDPLSRKVSEQFVWVALFEISNFTFYICRQQKRIRA